MQNQFTIRRTIPFERNNKFGNVEIKELDFTSFEIKKGVKLPIKMSYDERIEKDPNSDEIKNLL